MLWSAVPGRGQTGPDAKELKPQLQLEAESNLVLVRVVVRDGKGAAVAGLTKEDFKVADRGKKQVISQFEEVGRAGRGGEGSSDEATPEGRRAAAKAKRFVAFYFDTLNSSDADLMQSRDAAERYLAGSMLPSDRVALFTSDTLLSDFTTDRDQIHAALERLHRSVHASQTAGQCPRMSETEAIEILSVNDIRHDPAWTLALEETKSCMPVFGGGNPADDRNLVARVGTRAKEVASESGVLARANLEKLEHVTGVLGEAPGARTLVLVTPGFLSQGEQPRLDRVIDRAVRSQVVISSLDPKGLAVMMREADATRGNVTTTNEKANAASHTLDRAQEFFAGGVMQELAQGTGGRFVHNQNDLKAGFDSLLSREAEYVIAFSPKDLKRDGKYHELKVSLAEKRKGATVESRKGYFAPNAGASSETARAQGTAGLTTFSGTGGQDQKTEAANGRDEAAAGKRGNATGELAGSGADGVTGADRPAAAGPVPIPRKSDVPIQKKARANRPTIERLTADKLEGLLKGLDGRTDVEIATRLPGLELSERLSDESLKGWQARMPGVASRRALTAVADRSAFLKPRPADVVNKPPLSVEERQALLLAARARTEETLLRLPNFFATQVSAVYQDLPASHSSVSFVTGKPLHFVQMNSATVYYRAGSEVLDGGAGGTATQAGSQEGAVREGLRRKKGHAGEAAPGTAKTEAVLRSAGQFGLTLATVFRDADLGAMRWSRWEAEGGKDFAVFSYGVAQKKSHFNVKTSLSWFDGVATRVKPGYHGEVAIDPADGRVRRLTIVADLDFEVQLSAADVMVEYGPVEIGGKSYQCAVRSVAMIQLITAGRIGPSPMHKGFGGLDSSEQMGRDLEDLPIQTLINDVSFEGYHLFGSEATMITDR